MAWHRRELAWSTDMATTVELQAQAGPAWTIEASGRPIGSMGIVDTWPGVGELWVSLGENVERYPVTAWRAVKAVLRNVEYRHLRAHCWTDDEQSRRCLERLGFTRIGTCHGYGPSGQHVEAYERCQARFN